MRRRNIVTGLLFLLLACPTGAWAQFLAWDFEDIVTDDKESGVNPDMVIDTAGTIHISYWHRDLDKLVYAFKMQGSTTWTREFVDPNTLNGFVSAIALDVMGTPHIAYQENIGLMAQVRFASRIGSNNWAIANIPGDPVRGWGGYGPGANITAKERIVHTIDLIFDEVNEPQIVFFDGWMDLDAFPSCTQNSQYGFKLHQALKVNGIWTERDLGEVPDENTSCGERVQNPYPLPTGDRYGEYANLLLRPDGKMEIYCHSRFNNNLISFTNLLPAVDTAWVYGEVDSIPRILGPGWGPLSRFLTVEGIAATYGSDDVTHLTYTTSLFYGENFCCTNITNDLIYTRIEADTTIYYNFGTATYRNYTDVKTLGTDSVFLVYADLNTGQYLMQSSADSGKTWVADTIMYGIGISRLRLEIYDDSLHVLIYNSQTENIILARRHVNGGAWTYENVTISEDKGQVIDALVVPVGGDTAAHIAYTDRIQDELYYTYGTHSTGWNWATEQLDTNSIQIKAVTFTTATGNTPVIAYAAGDVGDLRLAARINGTWRYEIVDSARSVGFTDIAISALDTVHIVYYDDNDNCLKYASRHLNDSLWSYDAIDCANQPVGQYPSLELDAQDEPHVAYYDSQRLSLMYASKDLATRAWAVDSVNSHGATGMGKYASLKFGIDGLPKIAYLDEQTTTIYLSERNSLGNWVHQPVDSSAVTNMGRPIRMDIDKFGRPWIAYNYFTNFDKVKLVRRDGNVYNEVAVSSQGQIANAFRFQIVDNDLYIIGRKSSLGQSGVAMLYSVGGLSVDLTKPVELIDNAEITNYPNPFSDETTFRITLQESQSLSLRVFDLYGKTITNVIEQRKLGAGVHEFQFDAQGFAPGIYLYELHNSDTRIVKKFVIAQN